MDQQLRERRRAFKRRREALERIQAAAGELERRIADAEAQDASTQHVQKQIERQAEALLALAAGQPPAVAVEVPRRELAQATAA
jgi:uncharacterized protein YlxW (UPF0749 family)